MQQIFWNWVLILDIWAPSDVKTTQEYVYYQEYVAASEGGTRRPASCRVVTDEAVAPRYLSDLYTI